jgi:hypothetical protein
MMKILIALLATVAMAHAWEGGIGKIIDGPEIDGQWIEYSYRKGVPIAKASAELYKSYQRMPAFSVITGTTQQVDDVTGETNTVDVVESVPYGVVRESGNVDGPTLDEWQAWTPHNAAAAQAAFVREALTFLAGNGGENQINTVRFFIILQTMFPAITLPTTYDEALDKMNETIEAANTAQDIVLCNRLQNQSRIAQDIYRRLLEPNEWTGARLAQLATVMQGGGE